VCDRPVNIEQFVAANDLIERAVSELSEILPHLLCDELEEIHDELRFAVESCAQFRILGRHPHRAGVKVTDTRHDASLHNQRSRRKTKLLGTEQRPDNNIPTGLELPVNLHNNTVTHAVEHESLLRFCKPQLPRCARVLERVQGGCSGATIMPRHKNDIRECFCHPGRNRPDPRLAHKLDVYPRSRVRSLEIVDELLEVFDGVNVVVRGRRDKPHPSGRVASARNPRVHLRRW